MNFKFALLPSIAAAMLVLPVAAYASSSACSAAAGNLVQNCGFQTGDFTGWGLSGNDVATEQGNLFGVELGVDPYDNIAPHSGSYQAWFSDLSSNATTLTQNITTVAGKTYTVSFYLAQDTATVTPYGNIFDASFGNGLLDMSDVSVGGYTEYSFTGTATSANSLLSLTLGNGTGEFLLDDVSVRANATVPEPSSLALFCTAALLLLGVRLRSRRV